MPSYYLNKCWNIVNSIKLRRNLKQNLYIFIQENAFENVLRNGVHFVSTSMFWPSQFPYTNYRLYIDFYRDVMGDMRITAPEPVDYTWNGHYKDNREPYRIATETDAAYTDCANHFDDVVMGAMASQITIITIVYSIVYSGTDQRKYQSSVSLAFVRGIHRRPVNSPHKGPVTRKMFPSDDVIMSVTWTP